MGPLLYTVPYSYGNKNSSFLHAIYGHGDFVLKDGTKKWFSI